MPESRVPVRGYKLDLRLIDTAVAHLARLWRAGKQQVVIEEIFTLGASGPLITAKLAAELDGVERAVFIDLLHAMWAHSATAKSCLQDLAAFELSERGAFAAAGAR